MLTLRMPSMKIGEGRRFKSCPANHVHDLNEAGLDVIFVELLYFTKANWRYETHGPQQKRVRHTAHEKAC